MPTHPNPRDDPCHGQHAGPHVAPAPSGLTAPRTAMPETEPCNICKCRKSKPWKVQMPETKPWKVQLLQITEI
jgi:hypothetical protein